jgi:TolB-like protein/Tfp pilus assembly protein PilF
MKGLGVGVRPKIRLVTAVSPATRLTGWKEIASYLGRDARTVQLWEKQEELPIHRHTHKSRASVYAYPAELDAWLQLRNPEKGSGNEPQAPKAESDAESEPEPQTEKLPLFRSPGIFWLLAAAMLLVGILGAGFWMDAGRKTSPKLPTAALAVLPFENLSSSQDFLVDGLTDGLIADLGRTGQIQVISRRSVMHLKGQHLPLPQIASELHASLVLEGTVARSGDQVRITAQLLDTANDRSLWNASYSRKTTDQLAFQDEIAATIAAAVIGELTGTEPVQTRNSPAVNPQARLAYLTGRYFWNQRDEPGLRKAIGYFQQAAAIDPHYAPAYAGLADSYNLMAVWGTLPAGEAFSRSKAAAKTALSIDPASAEAYNSLAFATYRQDWDFARADQYFQKAIELNPNCVSAHQWYGEFLGDMRRFDASINELLEAKELDPLSAMAGSDLADGYLHAGRYAEAEAELKRIQNLYPDFVPAHLYLSGVYSALSNFTAAEIEAQAYFQRTGDQAPLQMVRIQRQVATGSLDQARRVVSLLLNGKSGSSFSAYQKAQFYFASRQNDAGYAALEDAYRERSWWLVTMLVDPGFSAVRNEPRFRNLARRVGLPV